MAYQQCAIDVISLLSKTYTNKVWNKTNEDMIIILNTLLDTLGSKCLCLDDEILIKNMDQIYNGLTITNYIVPITDIDIDPSLRQFNEYDKDYDECIIEAEDNDFKFNLT